MAHLSLSLLGPFQATLDGEPIAGFEANKVRALLAYLAVEARRHPGGHPRQALAGLLWPEKPERAALANLRNALANLRAAIGDRDATPPFLQITRETIQFNHASDHWLDVTAFQCLVESAAAETVPADRPAHQRLIEAVALYRGDLLEGFFVRDSAPFEEWALLLRERLHWQALEALGALTAYHEGRGAYAEAISCARREVALEPWQEGAHRRWMRALALSGQRGMALTQYATCCQVLADELGIAPEPATTTLYEQIREGKLVAPVQEPRVGIGPSPARIAASARPVESAAALPALPALPALRMGVFLDGERRTVTVVRADVLGSAELLARLGAEDWAELLSQVLHALGAEVVRFGGQVEQRVEGGLVACFGAATAHEDDPERALLAALAMQAGFGARRAEWAEKPGRGGLAEDLRLLVAVHTGPVVVKATGEDGPGQGTAMEETITLAARMQTVAAPGEVWVSEATRRLVEPLFEWAPRGEIGPGAGARAVGVSCALGRRAHLDKMRGIAGLSSPLIGRDAERRALQGAVDRLQDGVGGIVTVVGEAGIGKSRLVADCRGAVVAPGPAITSPEGARTAPLRWIEGRCLSYATGVAYQVWVDALRGLLGLDADAPPEAAAETLRERVHALCPDCGDEVHPFLARMMSLPLSGSAEDRLRGIEGEGLQVLIFRAVERLLERAAERCPLVVVCEDLHWADAMSLELLLRTFALADRVPILWICVFRPETERDCWLIKETAARRYAHRHTDLWLSSLSAGESAQLVGSLLHVEDSRPELAEGLPGALRSCILDRAEGNPLYIEEILRSLIDDGAIAYDPLRRQWQAVREVSELALPGTLRGVLAARSDRLPRETRQVLQLASIVGRIFTHRVLAAVCSPLPRQEEESASRPRGEGLGVGRALDAHLVALQRAQMVREQSRVPEATYLFKHQLTLEAAYDSLLLRKRRVLHRRVAEALEHLYPERVEEQPGLLAHHWERAGEAEHAIPYLRRAGEQAAAHFANAEAIAYLSRALDMLAEDAAQRTPEWMAKRYALTLVREQVYDLIGDREAQDQDLASLAGLADALGDVAKQAEVAVRRARYFHRLDENAKAASAAQAAARLAQAAQDVRLEAMACRTWGRALRGNPAERQRHLERALTLAQDAGLREVEAEVLRTLGSVFFRWDNVERSMGYWERGLRICRELGDRKREGEALHSVGWALAQIFNWTESETCLRRALNLCRETGNRRDEAWALHALTAVSFFQGHYAQTMNQVEQGLRICREVRDRYREGQALFVLGRVCTELVDYARARDCLEQGLRIYREKNNRAGEGWALLHLGLVFHLQGDYASAGTCYGQTWRIGRELRDWPVHARALMHLGLLSHHLGDDGAARAYSQQALRIIPNLDLLVALDLIYVYAVLGHALAGLGHPAQAAENYRRALTLRRERGQHHLAVEPLAGLARVALAQGDPAEALARVGEVLGYVEDHPALHGTLEPLRIYLTCYGVLSANGDPRAGEILDAAYHLLRERAATIEDEDLRRSYLENVAAHRQIVALWEEASHP